MNMKKVERNSRVNGVKSAVGTASLIVFSALSFNQAVADGWYFGTNEGENESGYNDTQYDAELMNFYERAADFDGQPAQGIYGAIVRNEPDWDNDFYEITGFNPGSLILAEIDWVGWSVYENFHSPPADFQPIEFNDPTNLVFDGPPLNMDFGLPLLSWYSKNFQGAEIPMGATSASPGEEPNSSFTSRLIAVADKDGSLILGVEDFFWRDFFWVEQNDVYGSKGYVLEISEIDLTDVEELTDIENFLLPEVDDEGQFVFEGIDVFRDNIYFFDPIVAIGYEYEVDVGSPLVQSILAPSVGGDSTFQVFYDLGFGEETGTLLAGQTFDFSSGSGGGVSSFRIEGIDPTVALNPLDPLAFPLGITFGTNGSVNLTQTAITLDVPDNAVPAPATLALLGIGLCGFGFARRFRPARSAEI